MSPQFLRIYEENFDDLARRYEALKEENAKLAARIKELERKEVE